MFVPVITEIGAWFFLLAGVEIHLKFSDLSNFNFSFLIMLKSDLLLMPTHGTGRIFDNS